MRQGRIACQQLGHSHMLFGAYDYVHFYAVLVFVAAGTCILAPASAHLLSGYTLYGMRYHSRGYSYMRRILFAKELIL